MAKVDDETIEKYYSTVSSVIDKLEECNKCKKQDEEALYCRKPSLFFYSGKIAECSNECEKAKKAEWLKHVRELTMFAKISQRFKNRKFDTFKTTKENKKAFETAKRYAEKYPIENGLGLLITGTCGTGKTHLAVAILHALLEKGCQGLFCTVPDLLAEIRRSYSADEESKKIKEIMRARFLVLDDLGAEKTTDWVQEQLYMLINYRYEYELPTVITSNLNIGQLAQKIGERSASRLLEMCVGIELNGEDYRAKVI